MAELVSSSFSGICLKKEKKNVYIRKIVSFFLISWNWIGGNVNADFFIAIII